MHDTLTSRSGSVFKICAMVTLIAGGLAVIGAGAALIGASSAQAATSLVEDHIIDVRDRIQDRRAKQHHGTVAAPLVTGRREKDELRCSFLLIRLLCLLDGSR